MSKQIKAKCQVIAVANNLDAKDEVESQSVKLINVYSDTPENKEWSKWTPVFNLEMVITNPAAFGAFKRGDEIMVTFDRVEKA